MCVCVFQYNIFNVYISCWRVYKDRPYAEKKHDPAREPAVDCITLQGAHSRSPQQPRRMPVASWLFNVC